MSSLQKRQLKAAKEAIQAGNYEYSQQLSQDVLQSDPKNYNALVFLALSNSKLKLLNEAVDVYENAIKLNPKLPTAYQGLRKLYEEERNNEGILRVLEMESSLILDNPEEKAKFAEYLKKRVEITRRLKDPARLVNILSEYLHHLNLSNVNSSSEPPSKIIGILREIIEIKSSILKESIRTAVNERRLRLNADPLPVLTGKIEREFYVKSDLFFYYDSLINMIDDEYEKAIVIDNFLYYLIKKLAYCREEERIFIRSNFETYAQKHLMAGNFSLLAISALVEMCDKKLEQRDLKDFMRYAQEIERLADPNAKFLTALFHINDGYSLDSVSLVIEGLESCPESVLGNILYTKFLYDGGEWLDCISQAEKTVSVIKEYCDLYQIELENVMAEVQITIGNACLNLGSSHIMQALSVFKSVLKRHPNELGALLGLGKSFTGLSSLTDAKKCFEKILTQNSENMEALSELGWINFLQGNLSESLTIIEKCLQSEPDGKNCFRLARVYYAMGNEYLSNKNFTHANLIKAIKLDPQFSPSFSLLGNYYRDVEKDIVRAIKCYSKAITINPVEEESVLSLSKIWIQQDNQAAALNLLDQYVTLNARAAWAWKQLGVLKLGSYSSDSIACFQTALRIDPDDGLCWTCLGEAYYAEGKYVASLKALDRALLLDKSLATAIYFHAKVNQTIGKYEDSINMYKNLLNLPIEKMSAAFFYGVADTCISYAIELHGTGYYGSCAQHLIWAIKYCGRILDINLLQLGGTACMYFLDLVPGLINAECISPVLDFLRTIETNTIIIEELAPLQILIVCGLRCYSTFLENSKELSPSLLSCIHSNISKLHYYAYKLNSDSLNLDMAINSSKNSIKLGYIRWEYWSNFGVLLHGHDKHLSQQLLIKGVELNILQPEPWSNLGFFYLIEKEYELSKLCFEKAQFFSLEFPSSWLGLAIISEAIGCEDSFQFFEHSYDISKASNSEILYQYARQCYLCPSHHLSSEVEAAFALRKLTETNLTDCCTFNLYGLILEREGKFSTAIDAFQAAFDLIKNSDQEKMVAENLGRCLRAYGRFEESVVYYQKALDKGNSAEAFTMAGCGLSLYFLGLYEESLGKFQDALNFCQEGNQAEYNTIALLISKVVFALGVPAYIEISKQQLFSCFAMDSSFIPAILCLCAMGIVLDDSVLAQTAATELIKLDHESTIGYECDIDMMLSLLFAENSDLKTATRFLSKSAHRKPWLTRSWYQISRYLYTNSQNELHIGDLLNRAAIAISKHSLFHLDSVKERSSLYLQSGLTKIEMSRADNNAKSEVSKSLFFAPSNWKNWTALAMLVVMQGNDEIIGKKLDLSSKAIEKLDCFGP